MYKRSLTQAGDVLWGYEAFWMQDEGSAAITGRYY